MLFGSPEEVRAEQLERLAEAVELAAARLPVSGDHARGLARRYFRNAEMVRKTKHQGATAPRFMLEHGRNEARDEIAAEWPGELLANLAAAERFGRADAALYAAQLAETEERHTRLPGPLPRAPRLF